LAGLSHRGKKILKNSAAWLATQCSSRPFPGKFPDNREFCDFGALETDFVARNAAPQSLFAQFPTQINRENISKNREFFAGIREFSVLNHVASSP
jgi:hypothetical protein